MKRKNTVTIEEAKEILMPIVSMANLIKVTGSKEIMEKVYVGDGEYAANIRASIEEVVEALKEKDYGDIYLHHVTGDTRKYWVAEEFDSEELDENGNNIHCVEKIGEFDTKEEAKVFLNGYSVREDAEYEIVEFDPDESWMIAGENGEKYYCEEQGKEVYPTMSMSEAVARLALKLGKSKFPETAKYFMKSIECRKKERAKNAEERLLKAIFGEKE